jgi:hypothetical protein
MRSDMLKRIVGAALAGVALSIMTLGGCDVKKNDPLMDLKTGDGTHEVGKEIAPGTWVTANAGPHTANAQCEWYVEKKSAQGRVTLRSHEPGNTIQKVYLANGDIFHTHRCGTWARTSVKNQT